MKEILSISFYTTLVQIEHNYFVISWENELLIYK